MGVPAFEVRRKGWHMASGVVVAPMVVYTNLEYVSLIAAAAFVFILVTEWLHIYWGIRVPFWADRLARTKREHETISLASLAFLATVVLLLWLAPLPVALAACAQLALGDGMSALAGRAFGRTRIPYNRGKTLEGSLSGFLAGAVGAYAILAWYYWETAQPYAASSVALVCLVGAFFASLAETAPRLEDNVTVPLSSGIAMTLAWWVLDLAPRQGELVARLMGG